MPESSLSLPVDAQDRARRAERARLTRLAASNAEATIRTRAAEDLLHGDGAWMPTTPVVAALCLVTVPLLLALLTWAFTGLGLVPLAAAVPAGILVAAALLVGLGVPESARVAADRGTLSAGTARRASHDWELAARGGPWSRRAGVALTGAATLLVALAAPRVGPWDRLCFATAALAGSACVVTTSRQLVLATTHRRARRHLARADWARAEAAAAESGPGPGAVGSVPRSADAAASDLGTAADRAPAGADPDPIQGELR